MARSSLHKKMLRPESMPEIKRLQELKRQVLSGEALGYAIDNRSLWAIY